MIRVFAVIIFSLIGVAGFSLDSAAQVTAVPTPLPQQAVRRESRDAENQRVFDSLRNQPGTNQSDNRNNPNFVSLNRKPSKKDLRLVAPDAEYQTKYTDFLRQPKTGLVRLMSDRGCQEYSQVTRADDFCVKYRNLFGGSAYSFRSKNYIAGRYADVVYKDGSLYTIGSLTLGFLVDLGQDVSPDNLSPQSAAAKFVFNFLPPEGLPQIESAFKDFQKGVVDNGFNYRKIYTLKENHTYLLRSVAYRKRAEDVGAISAALNRDERKDVIIAFQVVKFADAEKSSVILLWKELQRKDAPKIAVASE